jgi:plastocyanin
MQRRRTILALTITAATTVAALVFVAAPASAGGGGCHGATEGTGTTVVLEGACFTPSIIHVDAGATVRFENHDPFEHNVYGTGWGIGELASGDSGRSTFADEGLYAFQCTFHPGMTGTVVVGDGDGVGNGAAVTVTGDAPAAPSAPVSTDASGSTLPAAATGLLLGLAVGAGAMAIATRRRRVAAVPASA